MAKTNAENQRDHYYRRKALEATMEPYSERVTVTPVRGQKNMPGFIIEWDLSEDQLEDIADLATVGNVTVDQFLTLLARKGLDEFDRAKRAEANSRSNVEN